MCSIAESCRIRYAMIPSSRGLGASMFNSVFDHACRGTQPIGFSERPIGIFFG